MPIKKEDDFFWEGVDQGELLAQKCRQCGTLRHPPSPRCPDCACPDWETYRLSGKGKIHTWIVSRHPSKPDPAPRTVILVDLVEGLRFVSSLMDAENVKVGAPVMLSFGEVNDQRLPLFRTVKEEQA